MTHVKFYFKNTVYLEEFVRHLLINGYTASLSATFDADTNCELCVVTIGPPIESECPPRLDNTYHNPLDDGK